VILSCSLMVSPAFSSVTMNWDSDTTGLVPVAANSVGVSSSFFLRRQRHVFSSRSNEIGSDFKL